MKRISLALILVLALLMPFAVAEEVTPVDPADCLGLWYATQVGMDGNTFPYAMMGSDMTLEFFADGSVTAMSGEDISTGTWALDEQGMMTYTDQGMPFGVTLEEETLVLDAGYMLIYLEREPTAAAEPLPEPDTDVTEASFVGAWIATEIEISGTRISMAGMSYVEMTLTINADYTALSVTTGEEPAELTWSMEGNVITITDGDQPVACTLRGGRLVLEADDMMMIFDPVVAE